ncbi:MAG: SRPBCC domain-containing protein [Candidatus Thermoplasmatota archaeon]|nr:SRPBCC domain-containing protein [Candidatus Thermoplasmatota archaeon]
MLLEGEFTVNRPVQEVNRYLRDMDRIMTCLPGLQQYTRSGEDYVCKIKLDVSKAENSYLSTLSGKLIAKYEDTTENMARISANGRVAGSSIQLIITVETSPEGESTSVSWSSEMEFGLLIRIIGESKVRELSRLNIENTIECIRKQMETLQT